MLTNADQVDSTSLTTANGLPAIFGFDLAGEILDRLAKP
jgi:hypothetical protein